MALTAEGPGAKRQPASRVATDPRISRRRRAVERGKRRRFVSGMLALALVAGLIWAMFFSPLLRVRDLKLQGAERTTLAEVASVTELLDDDRNLLLLSTAEVKGKVETLPWVASAEVARTLPGTVKVRVRERQAALVLSLGAARWTIDAEGNVLATGAAEEGLPILAGLQVDELEPGLRLQTEEAVAALEAFRRLPRVVQQRVTAVFAPSIERISFSLESGTVVRFGAAQQLDAKNQVLRALFERLGPDGGGAAYIDVRVPTSPAVSGPRPGGSPSPGASPGAPSPSP